MAQEYSVDLQKLYLSFLLSDKDVFVRCNSIISNDFFDHQLRETIGFIRSHVDDYKDLPTFQQVKAKCNVTIDDIPELSVQHKDWFVDEFEQFCRHKALETAILDSADLLEKHEYGAVELLIKEAVQIGLAKNLGMNYFEDPEARIRKIMEDKASISTGWKTIDEKLYGGFNRGELNIFAGGSGSGKSIFLQNLALNWAAQGLNTVYVSLELSESLSSMRMDSMLTGIGTREVFKKVEQVATQVAIKGKSYGKLQVVQLQNGCSAHDLKSYIKEYEIQNNCKVDAVAVDYLDLMMPAQRRVPPSDLYIKDKFVSEELRNFAVEGDFLFATASQLNRGAVDEIEFDHSHISGGLSKIQTADNVIGIFTSIALKERERVQIQFMKTRSSSGVGQKVELAFSGTTLRVQDLTEDEQEESSKSSNAGAVLDGIKSRNQANRQSENYESSTTVSSRGDNIRSVLSKIGNNND